MGAVYLADMKQLEQTHTDAFKEFMDGIFVVNRTDHNFNQVSTDQAQEHKQGVQGSRWLNWYNSIGQARDRWCLTFNQRSKLVEETCAMFGIQTDDPDTSMVNPKETGAARIARDESDVVRQQTETCSKRLIVVQSSGRTLNLEELLQHELFPVPLALADTAGNLRSTQKGALAQILEDGVAYESLPPSTDMPTCTIIDGQALVLVIGKPKGAKTFADLADVFVQTVFRHANNDCTRVDVVHPAGDVLWVFVEPGNVVP